jgi:hypothetical protein
MKNHNSLSLKVAGVPLEDLGWGGMKIPLNF